MYRLLLSFLIISLFSYASAAAKGPLAPVKTDSPRDTMRSFMEAMDEYKKGLKTGDKRLQEKIDDAVRCLDLSDISALSRQTFGRETAIFLKEVIDRVIVIDYEQIPNDVGTPESPLLRWRLKDTEITITRVDSGERIGEYLFSARTCERAEAFYDKVEHLPFLKGTGGGAGYKGPWLERYLPEWTFKEFGKIAYWQWMGLLVTIFLGLLMRFLIKLIGQFLLFLSKRTVTEWDDLLVEKLVNPVALLATAGVWFASLNLLKFRGIPLTVLTFFIQGLLAVAFIWIFYRIAELLTLYLEKLAVKTANKIDDQVVQLVSRSIKIFVLCLGVLLALQNMGIQIFSLIAGLGLGGLALALAAKDSLANFFGSIMVMLDRPFRVGDWIIAGGEEGTVEDIGFRSTRIRTFYNSLISIPNSKIATSGVDNMGLREYRRVKANIGITYDTPPEKIEAFIDGIKDIIKNNPSTRKDYYHVVFTDFGPSSLDILLYFFLKVPDWATELVERQKIFIEIKRLAAALGVSFAFPTQSLHVETLPGQDFPPGKRG